LRNRNSRLSGRWSLVSHILEGLGEATPTQRQFALVQSLLDRYGIVSREVVSLENLSGGFTPLYPLLGSMEESGKVRRGYFVEGLSGAQFAWPGAIDQLRQPDETGSVIWGSSDPANPYGGLLPWPSNTGRPRRAVGCTVVLVNGELIFYLDKGMRKILTFPAAQNPTLLEQAARALRQLASRVKGRCLRIDEIDGAPASQSPICGLLKEQGFRDDYNGLMVLA
jgi:ATP-dependent Lhr-like helicase